MAIRALPMRDVFLESIEEQMSLDDKIFLLSADFGSPVLDGIRRRYSDRFLNVGIAEQNLINISAGLASEGFNVYAYAIAPFITMRCYEQIRVIASLLSEVREMSINLIGVGAGYSYVVSGPTHQCYEDITLMRALPNFEIISPSDHIVARHEFRQSLKKGLRYFRFDAQTLPVIYNNVKPSKDGFNIVKEGKDLLLVATGFMTHTAIKVIERLEFDGFSPTVVDIFNITHFSEDALLRVFKQYQFIVSLEEGFRGRGGVDSLLSEFIRNNQLPVKFMGLGVEPGYSFELGSREFIHEKVGIGQDSIVQSIKQFVKN